MDDFWPEAKRQLEQELKHELMTPTRSAFRRKQDQVARTFNVSSSTISRSGTNQNKERERMIQPLVESWQGARCVDSRPLVHRR